MKFAASLKLIGTKKTMIKRILFLLLFIIPVTLNAHKINGYKFLHIAESGNIYGIEERLREYFEGIGFELVASYEIDDMNSSDKNQLLIAEYKWNIVYGGSSPLILTLSDITGKVVYKVAGQGMAMTAKGDMKNALKKIFKELDKLNYIYNPDENKIGGANIKTKFAAWTEDSIKNYLKKVSVTSLEGIYKNFTNGLAYYSFAILKDNDKYFGVILDSGNNRWKKGDIKLILSHINNKVYDIDYYDFNGIKTHAIGYQDGRALKMAAKEFDNEQDMEFLKIYPAQSTIDIDNKQIISDSGLKATGSGFIISGNIVATNYHVVENAENIKIGLKIGGSLEFYSARILSIDKTNDLALLAIKDENFKPEDSVPYSIISNSVDVGTSVFTMGYPMATVLGEEVKITDGLISSKTGYEGDVVTYQISAPIQPGNSGGALFDKKGNLIGITNAGIDAADNVGYAIKSSYLLNLIDSAPINIPLSKGEDLTAKELPEIIKILTPYIAFIKVY